jgi:uncharacterized protein (TIGR02099 family)
VKQTVLKAVDKLWYVLAACVIMAALLVSIARLLTPVLMEHRADFEKLASNLMSRPVLIRQIEITWHRYEPEISLEGITILDPKTQEPKLEMDRLAINFNIWRSLWLRQAFIQNMTIDGLDLTISHTASGEINVADLAAINMKDSMTGQSVEADSVFTWIFSQPSLGLRNINVHYTSAKYPPRFITLKSLTLTNTPTHHVLDGSATLNQQMPVNVDVHLGWDGDIRKLPEANGHVYLYFEGLSLPQWFSKMTWQGLEITQGLASTKLWVRWNHNKIYQVQTTFEIYDLSLYSAVLKDAQIFNRIRGSIGWKQTGNVQEVAGEEIYVDMPGHLWPTTNFSAVIINNNGGTPNLHALGFNYLDLEDVKHFLLSTTLLSADTQKTLQQLNPTGIVSEFTATLPPQLQDFKNYTAKGKLTNISVNSWQNAPGITHFSGSGNWNGKDGKITLASTNTLLLLPSLFKQALKFNDISGDIAIQKDSTGSLTFQTQHVHADNADLAADVKLTLRVPFGATPNVSPNIDMMINYTVTNLGHLASFMPVKIMDADLVKWMRGAFKGGHADNGLVLLSGNLDDFPFDVNPGKFLVTAQIKALDFAFAPDWPHLLAVDGDLTFSGSSMVADIHSATLLEVPLKNLRGTIPYLGPREPQVVNLDGEIDGDLTSGLSFIRRSPLQKTLGKDLAALELAGPMNLTLSLSIPVRKPDTAKVKGDIVTSGALLTLPAWNLQIQKLGGAFEFTDEGMTAKDLKGMLFNAPVTINITTQHAPKQAPQIQLTADSSITLPVLQKWLNLDLSQIAKGATSYQLKLALSSHQTADAALDQLTVESNLQGVSLDLPKPYGKTAPEQKDFQVLVDLSESKFLKIKLTYINALSAALALQKSGRDFHIQSGDIRLGDTKAAWQTVPGLMITGEVPEFDVAIWQDYFASLRHTSKTSRTQELTSLRGIDLSAGVLKMLGVQFHKARLQAQAVNEAWNIELASTELGGSMTVPWNFNNQIVTGHFDHLYVNSQTLGKPGKGISPRNMPGMDLTIDDVRFDDMRFGHVVLKTVATNGAIQITQFAVNDAVLQMNANGVWNVSGTSLQGTITTPNISDLLTQWGVNSSSLVGSSANANFNLRWPGAPYSPSLPGLTGTLTLKLDDGKIIHLSDSTNSKIGLGRLLNVLSLSSIPSGLSFHSRDSSEGFNFDSISGDFTFRNGSAFTENLKIQSSIANVGIKGRIGLRAKDLDLQFGVAAHVTGSLPIVAAIAGGPIVGIAAWAVDKAVSKQMSVSNFNYTVTGSWANPVWQKHGQ